MVHPIICSKQEKRQGSPRKERKERKEPEGARCQGVYGLPVMKLGLGEPPGRIPIREFKIVPAAACQ
jgi:hypothetical protein